MLWTTCGQVGAEAVPGSTSLGRLQRNYLRDGFRHRSSWDNGALSDRLGQCPDGFNEPFPFPLVRERYIGTASR